MAAGIHLRVRLVVVTLLAVAGCHRDRAPAHPTPPRPRPAEPGAPEITWKRVQTPADMPAAPAPGTYQIHLIDVGTGLAVLVRGADFALLYDAGTNDREEKPARVAAYLEAALGVSGDDLCVVDGKPDGTRKKLDHVVLSHPHLDHASALDLVVHCYDVLNFWDSGRVNDAVFYRELLASIGRSETTQYRSAADVPADHTVTVKGFAIQLPRWQRFSEGDTIELGEGARFTILHAEAKQLQDPNQNSVVLAVELGGARLLLVGDAESGDRKDPSYPVGDVEEFLMQHHGKALRADILQVGHHGSKTSSRRGFLETVRPRIALVSSGPKMYGKVTLPDREVLDELKRIGATVLRTDEEDGHCPVQGRIGGDAGPGGCDSWVLTIVPPKRAQTYAHTTR
ncbi:MAG TPA: MBL fold metallo-hydrolase [Kofleriaceae bacterium]|nr:MBL fold metallo-hydrolase [Kofleriaceae bacterium]